MPRLHCLVANRMCPQQLAAICRSLLMRLPPTVLGLCNQKRCSRCGSWDMVLWSHCCIGCVRGAGIGGLCCAAILAHYGLRVTVCEAHYHAGGAAHGFDMQGYQFDAGTATRNPPATTGFLQSERVQCIDS